MSKAERLKWEVEDCAEKIIRATKLTGGLAGEKIRWGSTVKELDKDYENLLGDVLVWQSETRRSIDGCIEVVWFVRCLPVPLRTLVHSLALTVTRSPSSGGRR